MIARRALLAARRPARRGGRRGGRASSIAIAASGRLHLNLSDTAAANNATGGRASLVQKGVDLFVDATGRGLRLGLVLVRVPAPHRPAIRARTRAPA